MKPLRISFKYTNPNSDIQYLIEGLIYPEQRAYRQPGNMDRFTDPDEPAEWEFKRARMIIGEAKIEVAESQFSETEHQLIEKAAFEAAQNEFRYEDEDTI